MKIIADSLHEEKHTSLSYLAQFVLEWEIFQTS